jgi:5-methylcytosine-specific restriction endonuclease McrA
LHTSLYTKRRLYCTNARNIFKFYLSPVQFITKRKEISLPHSRLILPKDSFGTTTVKLEVWARDKGQCVLCGAKENLHFDHDLPYSKGGTSLTAKNVKILCAKHNLQKSDKILSFPPVFFS